MRRLYSTFASGWPGIGLILMRLVAGIALASGAVTVLLGNPSASMAIVAFLLACAAILLMIGLCTPIVGTFVALVQTGRAIFLPSQWQIYILVATLCAALAMLGPGLWSLDARLFGWKRIEPSPRRG